MYFGPSRVKSSEPYQVPPELLCFIAPADPVLAGVHGREVPGEAPGAPGGRVQGALELTRGLAVPQEQTLKKKTQYQRKVFFENA